MAEGRKKVLVIGGSYFAGRVFVEELAKAGGADIHVFNRGRVPLGMAGVAEHKGDRDDPQQIGRALSVENWDAVVDFCAYEPVQVESLLAQLPGRIGHYLLISTTSVYARSSALPVGEEEAKLSGPEPELGSFADYGYDKWRMERVARQLCERQAIPLTVFRPGIIYGFYNYAPRESYFFDLLRRKQPIMVPEEDWPRYSVIFVVDMARILLCALGNPAVFGEAINLVSDQLISYGRIIESLSRITGRPIEPVRLPATEIERRGIALPFPPDRHLVYSGAKAQRLLPVDHIDFTAGLRETLKYWLTVQRAQGPAAQ